MGPSAVLGSIVYLSTLTYINLEDKGYDSLCRIDCLGRRLGTQYGPDNQTR